MARAKALGQGEKRRERFREMSVAEFFARNKELAGFSNPTRALYQTVRELVENALDATDTHGILPFIHVRISYDEELEAKHGGSRKWFRVTVEDNGIGVPPTVIANAFGRVLFSSKYVIRQTRGMYGLGVKAAVLYGQMTAGRPVEVVSSIEKSEYVYMRKIFIDIEKNEPRVVERGQWRKKSGWHGTRVTISLEGDWGRSKSRIIEYIKRTAIIAPYAEIVFETPDGDLYVFPRMTSKMPPPPKEAKPHPHGIDLNQMKLILRSTTTRTLAQTLVTEFQSVGPVTARKFLREIGIPEDMKPKDLLRKEYNDLLVKLVDSMKSYAGFRAPKSDHLSPIGEDLIELGLKRMFAPEWVKAVTRPPKAYSGHSFIVEVGIAYGGAIPASSEPILLRYANKIPLLYEEREDVSYKVVSSINWKLYRVDFPAPLVVLVHIASTKVPYKGVGKESISDVPEIESEIRAAVQEVARKLRVFLGRKAREAEIRRKIITVAKYIPEIARGLAILSKPPDKWSPPSEKEERMLIDALVKLVARNIEIPEIPGVDHEDPEKIVRSVIENVELE